MQFLPDAAHPNDGDTVHAVASAVTHVAMALDELKDQLEIANRRVGEVAAAQITEAELGRLFVRAAEFADTAIAEAEEEARQVVADARMNAEHILADARIEAESIIEEAQRPGMAPGAAEQVQATIDGFTQINRELIKELAFLRDTLQPQLGAPAAPSLPAVPPPAPAPPTVGADTPPPGSARSSPWTPPQTPASYPDVR
jgi:vacuolar-type H+-ATPase subunit H